jgi:hypothetical protein
MRFQIRSSGFESRTVAFRPPRQKFRQVSLDDDVLCPLSEDTNKQPRVIVKIPKEKSKVWRKVFRLPLAILI